MSLGQRLTHLIEEKGFNQTSFAKFIGAKKQTISRVATDTATPNYSLIDKILKAFPDLSSEWFCRGKGNMWISEELGSDKSDSAIPVDSKKRQVIDIDVTIRDLVGEVNTLRKEVNELKRK